MRSGAVCVDPTGVCPKCQTDLMDTGSSLFCVMCGYRDHHPSKWCWCEPELEYVNPENGNEVWVHRESH